MIDGQSLSCPYCNAILTETDLRVTNHRALCPRCGETFPFTPASTEDRGSWIEDRPKEADSILNPPSSILGGSSSTKLSNRAIAFSVLAFMGILAMGFLWYAWETQEVRRLHDERLPKSQSITIPIGIAIACNIYIVVLLFAIFRPGNRPGAIRLTILAAGTTAVVVTIALLRVHIRVSSDPNASESYYVENPVQPVFRSVRPADWKGLGYLPEDSNVIAAMNVAELRETPAGREFLAENGSQSWNWQRLRDWIAVDLTEINHLIVGLKVDNNLLPRFVVIIETIRPLETDQVRAHLRASRWPDPEACFFPSNQVVVLSLSKKDLELIPQRNEGINHLTLPLQQVLRERIPRDAQVWAASHGDSWLKTPALGLLTGLAKENQEVVNKIQTFAVGLNVEKEIRVVAAFQCTDASAAKALERLLREPKSKELTDIKTTQQEAWVSFQAKLADISSLANRMSDIRLIPP